MAHKIIAKVPVTEVNQGEIEFTIIQNQSKLGTLKVSDGSIVWLAADNLYPQGFSWSEFAALMQKEVCL